jgi:hypothetical protein
LLPPKQLTLVVVVIVAVGAAELLTDTVAVLIHPLASVTVTTYDPAISPGAVAVVAPPGDHE